MRYPKPIPAVHNGMELTREDLGTLLVCDHCGVETFSPQELTVRTQELGVSDVRLPKGFTQGNARCIVRMRGMKYTLCSNCRHNPPYERY